MAYASETLPRSAFELSKWYLDAVGEDGEVFIGYRANLRMRRLAVSYASTLTAGARAPRTRSTVRPGEDPDFFEGALAWAEPKLGGKAAWRASGARDLPDPLRNVPKARSIWRCLCLRLPRGNRAEGGRSLRGLGYAEHLSMTLPPWRLPIDTLRWGRFLTPRHSVVWIDWESGATTRRRGSSWTAMEVRGETSEESVFFEGGGARLPARSALDPARRPPLLPSEKSPRSSSDLSSRKRPRDPRDEVADARVSRALGRAARGRVGDPRKREVRMNERVGKVLYGGFFAAVLPGSPRPVGARGDDERHPPRRRLAPRLGGGRRRASRSSSGRSRRSRSGGGGFR